MALIEPLHKALFTIPINEVKTTRSDKKHRYPFRTHQDVWDKIANISTLSDSSLNLVLNMLVQYALMDESIIRRIERELPQIDSLLVVRDWRASKTHILNKL